MALPLVFCMYVFGYFVSYTICHCLGLPVITVHPTDNDVPAGESITFICRAKGLGILVYSWERRNSDIHSSWTTVSNNNTTSYTTNTSLAIGQYMYRCRVSNEAGSVVSISATVNVYGECLPLRLCVMASQELCLSVCVYY